MSIHTPKTLVVSAIALALAACGGGGGGGGGVGTSSTSGVAIDGYLSGSTVVCDADNDGVADSSEATVLTDDNGNFEFKPKCVGSLLVFGGENNVDGSTSYPFLGVLQAPANSDFITPLTTLLVQTGISESALLVLLGLPEDTDLRGTNPLDNLELYTATLAVQQMVQELADVFGATPGDTDAFALIMETLATTLVDAGTPLFNDDGTINLAILQDTATAVNTVYGNEFTVGDLGILTTAIQNQAEDVLAATSINNLESILVIAQDPAVEPVILTRAQQNYLYLANDAFKINGNDIPFSTFYSVGGANTTQLSTIGFDFDRVGAPYINQTVSMVLTLDEVGGSNRELQLMISQVDIFLNVSHELEVTIPAGSVVYAHGITASQQEVNLLLNNLGADIISVNNGNVFTLDYDAIVQRIIDNPQTASVADEIEELLNLSGTINTRLVVSNLNFRYADNTALPIMTVGVPGAVDAQNQAVGGITGYGLSGKLVIAP